jgi:hypothetical protein
VLSALTRRWILRLLVPLQGHREFITKEYIRENQIAYALGLGDWVDVDEEDFDRKAVLKLLRLQYKEDQQCSGLHRPGLSAPLRSGDRNSRDAAPAMWPPD